MDMPALEGMPNEKVDRDQEHYARRQVSSEDDNATINGLNKTDTRRTDGGYGEHEGNAVDIDTAMQDYEELRKELTQHSRRLSKSAGDAEAGTPDFDLTDFLRNQNEQGTAAGFHPKHMGVYWKNLVVQGLGADAKIIPTNYTWLSTALQFWKWGRHEGTDFTILKGNDGFCKDGEMLLVLGRPGAGCTTLLRIIANMRKVSRTFIISNSGGAVR
jgi:hypothetical protein